jgi:hypothetical protein
MAEQVDPTRALPFLHGVATSNRAGDAYYAITEIERFAFGPGRTGTPGERQSAADVLRRLYDVDSLKSGSSISAMCSIARDQEWVLKPACRGRN